MRLFAAIRPPADVLAEASRALDAAVAAGAGTPRLRRVRVEQLHITVGFFGEVADGVVPDLTERLRRVAARTTSAEWRLAGAGGFPRRRSAQVLWLGLAGDTTELARLADRAAAAGRRCGIAVEERAFRPHLTVARLRPAADVSAVVERLASWSGEPWRAGDLELVRSRLGAQVRHEVMERFPLGGYQA